MAELKKVLIVNADDFGRSPEVNRGVAVAHENGLVTSASLMVMRGGADEAAAYARSHPAMSVGLHCDLGEWLFRNGRWEQLVEMPGMPSEQIRQQLRVFEQLVGRHPTHLDSHQHVHREEPVASILGEIGGELGVPVRGRDVRVQYCGSFYGQSPTGEPLHHAISSEALITLIRTLDSGITELGCHPGIGTDADLPYGSERGIELQSLCDPRVRKAITDFGVDLRSFANYAL